MAEPEHPPISTTIPSAEPPSTAPPPSKSPSANAPARRTTSSSPIQRLRLLILRFLYRLAHTTDRNLVRLSQVLSTPAGTDSLLCTFGYTLELLNAILSRVLEHRLAKIADTIADKASDVLLPGETLIATYPAPTTTKILAQIAGSAKVIAAVIADFRIFVRMWGLVGIYTWARATYTSPLTASATRKEKLIRGITWTQIASCITFQVLENGAYLASKGALTSTSWSGNAGKAREIQWWIWSSRFWAAHVFLEFVRLYVLKVYREPVRDTDGEKEGKLALEEERKDKWLWWRDAVSNVAYAPMTLHWSIDEPGLLSDWGVGVLGAVAGGVLLVDAWKATA